MKHSIKRISLEISSICNSHCITCPHEFIRRDSIIDVNIARRVIEHDALVYKDGIQFFEFHNYNEPLLQFDLFLELAKMVQSIYGDYKIGLVSNGSVMSPKIACELIKLKPYHIYFSVDGFSKEVFELHRNGLNRDAVYLNLEFFIDVCEIAEYLTDEKVYPYISFTITEKNRHEIEAFKAYFANKHCHVSFQNCDGRGESMGKEPAVKNIFEPNIPCNHAIETIYILSNLDVIPCCQDWNGIAVMGNLREQSLQEIFEGEKYQLFRELQMTGRKAEIPLCANCKTNLIEGYSRV